LRPKAQALCSSARNVAPARELDRDFTKIDRLSNRTITRPKRYKIFAPESGVRDPQAVKDGDGGR
jgi:hypothetical protein